MWVSVDVTLILKVESGSAVCDVVCSLTQTVRQERESRGGAGAGKGVCVCVCLSVYECGGDRKR